MTHPIATELSYLVLERQRRLGELPLPNQDCAHRRAYRVTGYRAFIPDVDELDNANPNLERRASVGFDDRERR